MSELRIRNLPEEDYEWLKSLAALDNVKLEAWMRRFIREARLGISPTLSSPAAVTLAPTGPLIPTGYRSAPTVVESISEDGYQPNFEDVLREADLEDSPKAKVSALQHMYDELFPPSGRYKYARLTESRAKEWLRCCGGSAIEVYEVLMDRVWNRVDDEGNYCDYQGKSFDNPAVYASAVLKSHRAASESLGSYKAYGHTAPLKELDPFPIDERFEVYGSTAAAFRKQGSISDEGWGIIQRIYEETGHPIEEVS